MTSRAVVVYILDVRDIISYSFCNSICMLLLQILLMTSYAVAVSCCGCIKISKRMCFYYTLFPYNIVGNECVQQCVDEIENRCLLFGHKMTTIPDDESCTLNA